MEYLKEDGSLDVERINKLPIEDYMDILGNLTEQQYNEYISKLPMNEMYEPVHSVMVDSLEEEIMRGGVFADDYIKKIKKQMLTNNDTK